MTNVHLSGSVRVGPAPLTRPPEPVIGMHVIVQGNQVFCTNLTTSRAEIETWKWVARDDGGVPVGLPVATSDAVFAFLLTGDYTVELSATTVQGVTIGPVTSATLSIVINVPDVTAPTPFADTDIVVNSVSGGVASITHAQYVDADGDLRSGRFFVVANPTDVLADAVSGAEVVTRSSLQLVDADVADRTFNLDVAVLTPATYYLRALLDDTNNNPTDLADTAVYSVAVPLVVPSTAPPTPGAFTLQAPIVNNANSISLVWGASSDAHQYSIEVSVDGGAFTVVQELPSTTLGFDYPASPTTTYAFKVRAFNQTGFVYSNTSSDVTTPAQGALATFQVAGMSIAADFHGDSIVVTPPLIGTPYTYNGKWTEPGRMIVRSDGQAPFGTALEKNFFIGDPSGPGPMSFGHYAGPWYEWYWQLILKYSPNFQQNTGGHKIIYWGPSDNINSLYYIMLNPQRKLRFHCQVSSTKPLRTGGPDEGVYDAIDCPQFAYDTYYKIDVMAKMQSSPTSSDAYVKVWVNDTRITQWKKVGGVAGGSIGDLVTSQITGNGMKWHGDSNAQNLLGFHSLQFFVWWGGNNQAKTVNDWVRAGRFLVMVK